MHERKTKVAKCVVAMVATAFEMATTTRIKSKEKYIYLDGTNLIQRVTSSLYELYLICIEVNWQNRWYI